MCFTCASWLSRLLGMNRFIRLRRFSMKPTVFISLGAVETRTREEMREGINRACGIHFDQSQYIHKKNINRIVLDRERSCENSDISQKGKERHEVVFTNSCAIIPPILIPMTFNPRSPVQPTWSRISSTSLAISDVEYLISGLSLSPTPRLSITRLEYVEPCVCPKSFV